MTAVAWDPRDVVATKRDGGSLDRESIRRLVLGYARGSVPDHVASAFLMACFVRGLDDEETFHLAEAMVDSGTRVGLEGVSRPTVDKHSTGGVADAVTLLFAPIAAEMGLAVAKLSGRGLGHTGGTLDKLEAIPGFRTSLSVDELARQAEAVGCVVAAQGPGLVPADGALYALRDATATVPSIPLIAASVMCKKLAVETDLVLLDVKAGSGAFMKDRESAAKLAGACVALAERWGRASRAAVTDMSQPLGRAIGNALDVAEVIGILRGERGRTRRLVEVAVAFAAAAGSLLGLEAEEAGDAAERALGGGRALERFRAMVEAQGGDPRVCDDPARILPSAPVVREVTAVRPGFLGAVDAEALGRASSRLGAGRARKGEDVDHAVGIVFHPEIGDAVGKGDGVATVHARSDDDAAGAGQAVLEALAWSEDPVDPPPLFEWVAESRASSRG